MHTRDAEKAPGQMTASIPRDRPIRGSELPVVEVTANMMCPSPYKGEGGVIDRRDPIISHDDDGENFFPDK